MLVEKLLRSCPDIRNIYLLIRPKRGQEVSARLTELLNAPVIPIVYHNQLSDLTRVILQLLAIRIIAPREAEGIKQSHTHIRRYNVGGAGHLRERSGGFRWWWWCNLILIIFVWLAEPTLSQCLRCLSLSCHSEIRREAQAVSHNQYAGHKAVGRALSSHDVPRREYLEDQLKFTAYMGGSFRHSFMYPLPIAIAIEPMYQRSSMHHPIIPMISSH